MSYPELHWMSLALKIAKRGAEKNCVPIGCVIIFDEKVIARAHNSELEHAEMICLRRARKRFGKYLDKMKLYCTVSPCPMCLYAIRLARIPIIIFGAENYNEPLPTTQMISGIYEEESKDLIKDFFSKLRKN